MTIDPVTLALTALLLPAASALAIGVLPPLRRSGRPAAWFSIACMAGAFASAILAVVRVNDNVEPTRAVWSWLPSATGPFATVGVLVDAQSSMMLVLVTLVALLVQVYSTTYLHDEPDPALGRYYALQSLFAFSMMGVVLAPNLLQLFICWELVGVCSCLLIGYWYTKPEAARAALKAFWTTKAGDVGLLIGIVLLHRLTGTFDLVELRHLADVHQIPLEGLSLITFCIYLGAAGKSAQFPLHVWLPDAMEGPTPVSALIHAATMVTAGVYLLTRTDWLFALTPNVLAIVAWNGAFTALLAAILACVQTDIKRVLAYSTVSQLGYMMAAIGAGFAGAGFLHLLTHGVFKALLFLGAGAVIHAVHSNEITDMGGLARKMPQTAIVFLIGTLSLAGVPLFAGFASKEEVLGAVWHGGFAIPFAMLLFAAFLTAFYMFRVVFLVFFADRRPRSEVRRPTSDDRRPSIPDPGFAGVGPRTSDVGPRTSDLGHGAHAHDAPVLMTGPLWVLALLALTIGIYFTFNEPWHEFEAPGWLTPAAIAVALSGILFAWLTYQRRTISADSLASAFAPIRAAALKRFWLDDLYLAIYRSVLLTFSRAIGWIDRYLVDGLLNVVSAWTLEAGDRLRRTQTGKVQDYVWAVGLGLLALMAWIGGRVVSGVPVLSIVTWSPFVAALVIMTFARHKPRLVRLTATLGAAVPLVLAVWLWFAYDRAAAGFQFAEHWPLVPSFGISYTLALDGMGLVLVLLTAIILFAGVFASWTVQTRGQEFYALLLLLVTGVFGVFVSYDLFVFFLFYEIAVLPMYLLIGIWGSSGEIRPQGIFGWAFTRTGVGTKEYAAMKLTLYLLLGSAFILVGILALYTAGGSTSFSFFDLQQIQVSPRLQSWVFLAFYVGFGILAGIWPLHTWSPDGHASAPTAVSMLHAGVLMKLGAYGVVRLGLGLTPMGAIEWAWLVGAIACINIVYGALSAMAQTDLKYVVAYSSVSHMGIVMLGIATLNEQGLNGAVFQMVAHGIMTGLFFALVGLVYEKAHSRAVFTMGGFGQMMPGIATAFAIGGFSSLGLPATAGFVAEFLTFVGAWGSAHTWWLVPGVLGAFLTSIYVLRVVRQIFWGEKSTDPHFQHLPDAQGTEWVALVFLVCILILFGVVPQIVVAPIDSATVPLLVRMGVRP